jgi:hypothetical protein
LGAPITLRAWFCHEGEPTPHRAAGVIVVHEQLVARTCQFGDSERALGVHLYRAAGYVVGCAKKGADIPAFQVGIQLNIEVNALFFLAGDASSNGGASSH